jgi:predicted TIM-barrel fold metal-dependent hydrolase
MPRRCSTVTSSSRTCWGIRNFGDGNYLVDAAWRRGFAELGKRNLVACIDTRIERAADILDIAGAFPDTQLCIDHCAIPMERTPAYFRKWRDAIGIMAQAPNVTMKVSGLGMLDPLWTIDSVRPYVLGSIEAFGTGRVVFGTNWPVDRMFSSYPDVIDAYAEIISGFTRDEQVAMFSGNAERLFRV